MRDDAVVNDDGLTDAPATTIDIRVKSPERKKATTRSTARNEEEASIKRINFEEAAMDDE